MLGNEKADAAAKRSLRIDFITKNIHPSQIKCHIREASFEIINTKQRLMQGHPQQDGTSLIRTMTHHSPLGQWTDTQQ